jgi:hypothetical protein
VTLQSRSAPRQVFPRGPIKKAGGNYETKAAVSQKKATPRDRLADSDFAPRIMDVWTTIV